MSLIHTLTKCVDIQIDYDTEETFYDILSGVRALTLKITISVIEQSN